MSATICFRRLNLWGLHWQSCKKRGRHLGTCCENQCQSKQLSMFQKSPWWNLSCDDDVWLREQASMNRAQNSFVDEQLAQVQSAHDELRCSFADHKTMQIRPATTYDLSDKSRICLLDLRDAPNCEFGAIRQHVRNLKPYMLTAQYNDDNSNDDSIRALCELQANQGGYFLLNLHSCPKEQDSTWDISLGFCTNLRGLIRSFAETGEDFHLHFDSAKRVAEAAVESAIARFQRTGSARRWDGTFFTTWSTPLIGNLAKVDSKKAERINQELQKNLCQTFQTDAAIDLRVTRIKCCESIFLKLPEVTEKRCFLLIWKKFTNRDIWFKRKTEDDETETARTLSEREKRESYSDNIVTWDIRSRRSWLVHCDTQEQDGKLYGLFSKSYVVQLAKHDLYRFHPVQECCHAVYVLTNALALTWLTWKSEMEPPLKH